ncbi:outer membrane protein assembly factor BamA [Nannocystis radixulma]|uniref:Outer membrane protein assembly factor BamA n=1 Tax=Nannocystis radixulma TaxID=2995305 RepID=A0ABT5BIQ5_9BACT|nr:outer membrane protein assembly factor BamA [Nannocystis radixulma]MDC0674045.1 outer membrane protein assembly factor BamA [Nannocystis radixulma]
MHLVRRGASLARALTLLACALVCLFGQVAAARPSMAEIGMDMFFRAAAAGVPQELYGQPIVDIRFEGNRRVESEAMMLELESHIDAVVNPRNLATDIKRLWGLGKFDDIRIEGELTPSGVVLTYIVKERPTIRKIVVEGNSKIKLDDINEQLDLKLNAILDVGAVRANVEKVKQLYVEKGFFLAEVTYGLRAVEDEIGKVDIQIVISEAAETIVRKITFIGNQAFTDDELRKHMITRVGGYLSVVTKKAGGVFNKEAFAGDFQMLKQFYTDNGYLDANVKDPELSLSPDRRFVYVTVPVDEGPQYRVGKIRAKEVLGRGEKALYNENILADSINPVIKEGDVASMGKIQTIIQDIERRYKDAGHAYVNVIPDGRQDRENLKLYMTLEVGKGPLVYIERINISGNDKTADKVIRREMALREGDLYSESGKEQSEFNAMRLGYFNQVTISTSKGSAEDKIVLNVEVTERLTGTFQVGAGFSTIENFVLQAQIQYDNFLGRGTTVTLVAQMSSLRRLFNLAYITRYFLDSRWNFSFNIFNSRNVFPGFSRESTGVRLSWGYPIPRVPNLILFAGYSFEYIKVGFGNFGSFGGVGGIGGAGLFGGGAYSTLYSGSALISNLFNNGITSAITASLRYDTTDNYLFPTEGMRHEIRAEFANKYWGSQNRFNRYDANFRFYFPIIRSKQAFRAWLVFKTRLQVGFIHSPQDKGVPVFERYFPGGIFGDGGIRGYRLRSLGPAIKVLGSSDPTATLIPYTIGGNLLTALNLELEFMMVPPANIKGVVFMDIGNAYNTEPLYCVEANPVEQPKSDPCTLLRPGAPGFLKSLRRSIGFGFRWQSPIGPLRFEWGFPLDRLPPTEFYYGDEPVVFEFNVGNSF